MAYYRTVHHSVFNKIVPRFRVVDEFTLRKYLGPSNAAKTIERHYASFINETAFQEMVDVRLDLVLIPFGHWATITLAGDSLVRIIFGRYILQANEYARKRGLRVNLDLHSVPGGANDCNHIGKLRPIG
ncbi:glycoside hydrolase superfamily [Tuber borchii]|uniref:glucan 1,3-beta-glucosidase n=1 Tax=Tuber borchii TaxID=42251 RepID=A0A2T7A064_TUBBO|nr:glycoside hydrolase superfamily [Tuber borchii]